MNKLTTLWTLTFLTIASISWAQNPTVLITDPDFTGANECDCQNVFTNGSLAHFHDSGGPGGNYTDAEDEEIVFCPDLNTGTKVSVAFGINAGFSWDVDATDTVYVYDGVGTGAPLLGAHNSVTDPNGFTHQASWANTSGCLTVRFVSDATNSTATGWDANVTCGYAPQPYNPQIFGWINGDNYPDTALSNVVPRDTGYVDVCFGDSVLFIGSGDFPFSLETTGFGYSQNPGNCTYEWTFSDGSTATGDSVWFTPPARSGYLVQLRMTDPFNWIQVIQAKVRVSTVPSFATTLAYPDTICLGSTSDLAGGVTNTDTVGVDPTQGGFEVGGTFAGLTYLPDGSGQNYQTQVQIIDFDSAQTVQNASDIQAVCITMEHSYLGDLEMVLECPDGTQGTIFNSYDGGGFGGELVPGGFNGGGTYLGDAFDNNIGNPGAGWEYCFDSNNPTFGTMGAELGAGNTVPTTITPGQAMNPNGVYTPEDPWSVFIGCPLNGQWTITVRDNLSIDDGYIFEWGVFFDPAINPNTEFYTPQITSEQWLADPTITIDSDTLIQVTPDATGDFPYTFQVVDNFGCTYDTTINVHVLSLPSIAADDFACDNQYQFAGTAAAGGGVWTWNNVSGGTATFNDDTSLNPFVTVDQIGPYDFTFTDNACGLDTTVSITFVTAPNVAISNADICEGDVHVFNPGSFPGANFTWSTPGNPNLSSAPTLDVTDAGTYTVTVTNICGSGSDDAIVTSDPCALNIPNVFSPNGDAFNENFVIVGLEKHPNSHLLIYNRWGKLVLDDTDYQNNWNGDGHSDGVYFYVLRTERGEEYTGNIQLVR